MRNVFLSFAVQAQDSPEMVLAPLCFEKLCQEKQIFSQESYETFFSKIQQKGLCHDVEDLVKTWERIKAILKHNLSFFEEGALTQLLTKVENLIHSYGPNTDTKKLWLNYKLLELETNRLHTESFVTNLLPDELLATDECICQLIENF